MIEAVWYGMAAALTFIGFVSLLCLAVLRIYRPKKKNAHVVLMPCQSDTEDTVNLIYSAHLRMLIFGSLFAERVTVIDDGLSESAKKLVRDTAAQYGGIDICTADDFIRSAAGKEKDGNGA